MTKVLLLLSLLATGLVGLESSTAPASSTAPRELEIDGVHSVVLFRTKHLGVSYFHGRFNEVRGEVVYDADDPSNSSIRVIVPAASVDTNSENRDRHLRSPDFFSAEEFPEIVFESKQVMAKGDDLSVVGDLTLHGITKEIQVEADLVGQADTQRGFKIGFECVFVIDARDFGIAYMQDTSALGPDVEITVAIECVPAE